MPRIGKLIETGSRMVVTGAGERRNGEFWLNGYIVSIWDNEKLWKWTVLMASYNSVNVLTAAELQI